MEPGRPKPQPPRAQPPKAAPVDSAKRIAELEAALQAARSGVEETLKSLQARLEDARAERAHFEKTVVQRAKERDEARREREQLRAFSEELQAKLAEAEKKGKEAPRAAPPPPQALKELQQARERIKTLEKALEDEKARPAAPPPAPPAPARAPGGDDVEPLLARIAELERQADLQTARPVEAASAERIHELEVALAEAREQNAPVLEDLARARERIRALEREVQAARPRPAPLIAAPAPDTEALREAAAAAELALAAAEARSAELERLLAAHGIEATAAPEVSPRVIARLLGLEGPAASQHLAVMSGAIATIGRGASASYSFDDPRLAPRHCALEESAGTLWVRDLHSASGTLVNGARIEGRAQLRAGDRLAVGASVLEVSEVLAGEPAAEAAPGEGTPSEGTPSEGTPLPASAPTKILDAFSPPSTAEMQAVEVREAGAALFPASPLPQSAIPTALGPAISEEEAAAPLAPAPTAEVPAIAEDDPERTVAVEAPAPEIGVRCAGCRVPVAPEELRDVQGNGYCPECFAKLG